MRKPSVRFALILLVVMTLGATNLHAIVHEQWSRRFPGPQHCFGSSVNVGVDSLNNVYVVQPGGLNRYAWMASKYSPEGVMLWRVFYDPSPNLQATAIDLVVDAAGDLFVEGITFLSSSDADILIVKYNTMGQIVWSTTFSQPGRNEVSSAMVLDDSGNIYIGGSSGPGIGDDQDYLVVKYNSQGILQWWVRYTGPDPHSELVDLSLSSEGNVVATGTTGLGVYYSPTNFLTVYCNSQGIVQWTAIYNSPSNENDIPRAIAVDSQGNVVVSGASLRPDGLHDCVTIKYTSLGAIQWMQRYPINPPWNPFWPSDMIVDAQDNVIITGEESQAGLRTVKYNSFGSMVWSRLYPSDSFAMWAGSVISDTSGNIYMTGGTGHFVTEWNVPCVTLKYTAQGDSRWISLHDEPNLDGAQYGLDLALDRRGNVITSAQLDFGPMGYQMLLIKNHQITGDLTATMIPTVSPVQIPDQGGSFIYNLVTVNGVEPNLRTNLWWRVIYPDNLTLITLDPLLVELPIDSSSVQHTQHVPGNAPAGTYQYILYAGEYPYMIWATDTIPVTKLPNGDGPLVEGWDNTLNNSILAVAEIPPSFFILHPCSPNPFNPTTAIIYQLSAASHVSLKVYDTAGRLVSVLKDGWDEAGTHEVTFDGSNIASGIYLYTLTAGSKTITNKMALLK